MAELTSKKGKKMLAFYLPQFHTIPENDKWWGDGFTEWTNTRKAVPLFNGHYQPKIPLDENYYDLADVTVMEKQAELAKKYGLYGFCYYHYWFKNGKKLLEKPIENMLKDEKVNIPFCLCWANENWSRNWDGGNREILMEQDYGGEKEWKTHLDYLMNFFSDDRYITYDGKPILLLYKPEEMPKLNEMIDFWQDEVKKRNFPGLCIIRQHPKSMIDESFDDSRLDYSIKFQPSTQWFFGKNSKQECLINRKLSALKTKLTKKKPLIVSYDETWDAILNEQPFEDKLISGAFVSWDNTARRKDGAVFEGSSPEKFEKYMKLLCEKKTGMDCIFINAWNEWAEGAYLEPDEKYGYRYLEALRHVVDFIENNN